MKRGFLGGVQSCSGRPCKLCLREAHVPRADDLIYTDCLSIPPSHLDGIQAKHICVACAQRYVGKQVDVAQLPGVQVVHEAAQSEDVAFLIIALVRGHLRRHTLTVSSGRPSRLQFLVPDTRGPACSAGRARLKPLRSNPVASTEKGPMPISRASWACRLSAGL